MVIFPSDSETLVAEVVQPRPWAIRFELSDRPVFLLVRWMIMNPDAPSDRPDPNAQPPEPPAARQAAHPSDLAALVLTRWHEATVAGQIDLPPPAASALLDVLSICAGSSRQQRRSCRSMACARAITDGAGNGSHRRGRRTESARTVRTITGQQSLEV